MNNKNTTPINSGNIMSGIYGMLLEVLQSITSASDLHDLLTGAFSRLRWIVNLDYCLTSFYRKGTDDLRQGVIINKSVVDKGWKWEKKQVLEDKITLAAQSKPKVFIESKGNENNLFNCIFDEHQELQQILCFTLPIVDKETAFIIIATRQETFEAQALNILNVFMEFLAVNIAKQRSTEDLDHALLTLENTQEQLIESEKMRALNSLVTGVAHEINTPLGVAITASSNLSEVVSQFKTEYEDNKVTRTSLEGLITNVQDSSDIVMRNLHRSSELVQSFKLISADQSSEQKRQFELKGYLDELVQSMRAELLKNGPTVTVESEQKIYLDSFPGVIGQIITHLILNSVQHAFKENSLESSEGSISIKLLNKNNYIHIDYKDDGHGLTEKQRAKVFEPFYTTARFTGGAGLGMSISYNLVTATLNGKIHCIESSKGAHFIISFPAELSKL